MKAGCCRDLREHGCHVDVRVLFGALKTQLMSSEPSFHVSDFVKNTAVRRRLWGQAGIGPLTVLAFLRVDNFEKRLKRVEMALGLHYADLTFSCTHP